MSRESSWKPNTYTSKDQQRTDKGRTDRYTSIGQWDAASVASNLGGGLYGNLALAITAGEYRAHTGFFFVTPHNPGNYPHSMGNTQEQALGTENFRQNQSLFRKYTSVEGDL